MIQFKDGFEPDQIYGTKEQLAEYQIYIVHVLNTHLGNGVTFEFPEIEMNYHNHYDAIFECDEDKEVGQVVFGNGVVFSTVHREDLEDA